MGRISCATGTRAQDEDLVSTNTTKGPDGLTYYQASPGPPDSCDSRRCSASEQLRYLDIPFCSIRQYAACMLGRVSVAKAAVKCTACPAQDGGAACMPSSCSLEAAASSTRCVLVQWELKPHNLLAATAYGNRLIIMVSQPVQGKRSVVTHTRISPTLAVSQPLGT